MEGALQGRKEELQQIICRYWQMEQDAIPWEEPFGSQQLKNFSSLRFLRFLAGVEEHFQIQIQDLDAIENFQDLLSCIENGRSG